MKYIRKILLVASGSLFFLISPVTLSADVEVIANAKTMELAKNLDLGEIVSIFNKSMDLADFEARLNDSEIQISNIDYNHDGELDYIRPIVAIERYKQVIILQAVLADDLYLDVASLDICSSTDLCRSNYLSDTLFTKKTVNEDINKTTSVENNTTQK